MTWLIPAVISTFVGSLILTFVYFFLYSQEKDRFHFIWAVSWLIYSLRYVFILISFQLGDQAWLTIANNTSTLFSGIFLLWGAYEFSDRDFSPWWWAGGAVGFIWISVAALAQASVLITSFPSFMYLAGIYIWTGMTIISTPMTSGASKKLTGWAFILWGIHKADFPFLRTVTWFAPWGFLLSAGLEMIAAVGMLSVYYEVHRKKLVESEERYRRVVDDHSGLICRFDSQGTLDFINRSYADFLGKEIEELLGTNLFVHIPPRHREQVKERLNLLTPENPQNRNRNLNVAASGELRWVEWTNRALFDDENFLEYQSVGYDIHDQLKMEEALKKSEQDYRELVYYLREAREDERSKLAREIHDELGQALTAIKFDVAWFMKQDGYQEGPERERLEDLLEMVDQTLAEVRTMTTNLRPDILENLGLKAALEWQLEDFSGRVDIQSSFEFSGEEDLIPGEVEIDIYRLVQEALTNIIRHAEADQVLVEIVVDQQAVHILIQDNGVGFIRQDSSTHKSFGVIGMRERMYRWDGDFEITGEAGQGTKVKARIPLQREKHD